MICYDSIIKKENWLFTTKNKFKVSVFSYYIKTTLLKGLQCWRIGRSGAGCVPNYNGSGSGKPKSKRIWADPPDPEHCSVVPRCCVILHLNVVSSCPPVIQLCPCLAFSNPKYGLILHSLVQTGTQFSLERQLASSLISTVVIIIFLLPPL